VRAAMSWRMTAALDQWRIDLRNRGRRTAETQLRSASVETDHPRHPRWPGRPRSSTLSFLISPWARLLACTRDIGT